MQRLDEIARLQKLAGITSNSRTALLESENLYEGQAISDEDIAKAISDATKGVVPPDAIDVDKLKQDPDSPDAIDKDKIKTQPGKKELNEVGLTATLILLAPSISNLVGKTINFFSSKFSSPEQTEKGKEIQAQIDSLKKQKIALDKANKHDEENEVVKKIEDLQHEKDKLTGSKVGNAFINLGHTLHKAYVSPIKAILDGYAWYQRVWNKAQGKENSRFMTDERYRENIANLIYCGIMIFVTIKSFLAHPAAAAEQLSKSTGGMISISTITSLLSNIKGAKTVKDAVIATMETV